MNLVRNCGYLATNVYEPSGCRLEARRKRSLTKTLQNSHKSRHSTTSKIILGDPLGPLPRTEREGTLCLVGAPTCGPSVASSTASATEAPGPRRACILGTHLIRSDWPRNNNLAHLKYRGNYVAGRPTHGNALPLRSESEDEASARPLERGERPGGGHSGLGLPTQRPTPHTAPPG